MQIVYTRHNSLIRIKTYLQIGSNENPFQKIQTDNGTEFYNAISGNKQDSHDGQAPAGNIRNTSTSRQAEGRKNTWKTTRIEKKKS